MTSAFRSVAILITAILLLHPGGMAVDPMALHAPIADDGAHGAAAHHAGHGAVSADELATVESAWSCMDTEGVASTPRAPLASTALVAVMPVLAFPAPHNDVRGPVHWAPPPLNAADLRAFLQVFLN